MVFRIVRFIVSVQWVEKHISICNIIGRSHNWLTIMCKNIIVYIASYVAKYYTLSLNSLIQTNSFTYLNTFNIEVTHRCLDNQGPTVHVLCVHKSIKLKSEQVTNASIQILLSHEE